MKLVWSAANAWSGEGIGLNDVDPGAPESLTDVTLTVEFLGDQRGDATC